MLASIREAMRAVPLSPWLAGMAALGLTLEIWLLIAGLKLRRAPVPSGRHRNWVLEAATVVTVVGLGGLGVIAVNRARGLLAQLPSLSDPMAKAALISDSVTGQMNGIPMVLGSLILLLSWGTVAFSVSYCARRRAAGLRFAAELAGRGENAQAEAWRAAPGPGLAATWSAIMLVLGMGLLPLVRGGLDYATTLIRSFAGMAGFPPEQKVAMLEQALSVGRVQLDAAAAAAPVGLGFAALAAAVILFFSAPERTRRRMLRAQGLAPVEPPVKARSHWGIVAAELAAAAALFALARPLRAENAMPWPPMDPVGPTVSVPIETPALAGPDQVHRAPVVVFKPDGVELDGMPIADPRELGDKLSVLRINFNLLNAGVPFGANMLVLCTPATAVPRMRAWMRAAALAEYEHALITFIKHERLQRPLLGPIDRISNTAARADLHIAPEEDAPLPADALVIDLTAQTTCGELASRVVEQRRQGRTVVFDLGRLREETTP